MKTESVMQSLATMSNVTKKSSVTFHYNALTVKGLMCFFHNTFAGRCVCMGAYSEFSGSDVDGPGAMPPNRCIANCPFGQAIDTNGRCADTEKVREVEKRHENANLLSVGRYVLTWHVTAAAQRTL